MEVQSKQRRRGVAPQLPKRGTRAAASFFSSWREINRFFNFVLNLVSHIEKAAQGAHKVLVETEHDEAKRLTMIEEWKKRVSPVDELKKNRQFFIEVIYVRHVENFLNYLSSLLYEIFTQRPETLRSSDKVEIAAVLKHESIESVVRELAERKVESLSYSSFSDLADFFRDRFSIALSSDADIKRLAEAIEVRNISVHNRCIINRRFISRLSLPEKSIGTKRDLFVEDLNHLVPLLAKVTKTLDKSVMAHLKVKGVLFSNKREDKHES